MATKEVKLPDIGEGVTEGEMVKWLVKPGDKVEPDQPVAEIMTDKATVEVPSPFAGVVKELKVKEGDVVPIETTLLVLDMEASSGAEKKDEPKKDGPKKEASTESSSSSGNETKPAPPQMSAKEASGPSAAHQSSHQSSHQPSPSSGGGLSVHPPASEVSVLATPSTRRLAREMNVDINQLKGSGLAGRVTREDVLKVSQGTGAVSAGQPQFAEIPRLAYSSPAGAQSLEERTALRGIRRKIAEQMQTTKHIVPHFTIMDEADVTELVKVRAQAKALGEKYGVKVTYLPFIMKALIAALREFPMLNASIDDAAQEIVYKKYFNIGFAADTPNGLMVPVIKNADQKTILQISKEILELATNARNGKLALEDMKGATITITNIGSVGGTYATPIINHPEVAIIGVYKVDTKPVWKEGQFVPRQVMNLTATCDHRLIDGAVAANFLKALLARIENPAQLMLDMI